jgi:putative toxin-antitoxin system antitoxin component (TIGR02293 family)
VLGDDGKAFAWMRRPNRALGGQPPVELVRTGEGARLVDAVLTRLEHGVFS